MTETQQEQANAPWRLLGTLPSTNAKIAANITVLVLTALVYLGLVITSRDTGINVTLWDSWLIFIATLSGVNTVQYLGKRKTYQPGAPDDQRSQVATAEVKDGEVR